MSKTITRDEAIAIKKKTDEDNRQKGKEYFYDKMVGIIRSKAKKGKSGAFIEFVLGCQIPLSFQEGVKTEAENNGFSCEYKKWSNEQYLYISWEQKTIDE